MGELINGKMPEHIKAGLRCRVTGDAKCSDCAYYGTVLYEIGQREYECDDIDRDALALIERLESERDAALAKVPRWISVNDMMPEPYQHVIVHVQHTKEWREYTKPEEQWHVVEEDCWLGEGWEGNADTGIHEVTHWMPKPEPPKEGE